LASFERGKKGTWGERFQNRKGTGRDYGKKFLIIKEMEIKRKKKGEGGIRGKINMKRSKGLHLT